MNSAAALVRQDCLSIRADLFERGSLPRWSKAHDGVRPVLNLLMQRGCCAKASDKSRVNVFRVTIICFATRAFVNRFPCMVLRSARRNSQRKDRKNCRSKTNLMNTFSGVKFCMIDGTLIFVQTSLQSQGLHCPWSRARDCTAHGPQGFHRTL